MKPAGFLLVSLLFLCVLTTASCVYEDTVAPRYREQVMTAMEKMQPGDWVLYYLNRKLQLRMQVLDRDEEGVEIEYRTYLEKGPRQGATVHRFEFDEVRRNLRMGRDIYGRKRILEMTSQPRQMTLEKSVVNTEAWAMRAPEATITQYISEELTLWGIAAQKRNNSTVLLARSWGRAGEKVFWPDDLMPLLPKAGRKKNVPLSP